MAGMQDIIEEMRCIAPPGMRGVDNEIRERLQHLTGLLLEADSTASTEYERFLHIKERELDLTEIRSEMRAAYAGKRILVTGGTGCIGRALISQLLTCEPKVVYSLSRGRRIAEFLPDARYITGDITDPQDVRRAFTESEPDVVFHLAAQRSPWLAEREVVETVMTNVLGTRNVLRACREFDVQAFIHASTGKAMKYYTTDVYAATKKVAEWLVHEYAGEGRLAGSGRFTHVVDNGVILEKIQESIDQQTICRIHEPDIQFYVQSAVESAQLLLLAGLNTDRSRLRMVAIRCLGEPARLLSMTLGMIGRSANYPPVYFSGYESGYERGNPPGLYDPRNAADLSPLINALEAQTAGELPHVAGVDRFYLTLRADREADGYADLLAERCSADDAIGAKASLAATCTVLAQASFDTADENLYSRLDSMARSSGTQLPCTRRRTNVGV